MRQGLVARTAVLLMGRRRYRCRACESQFYDVPSDLRKPPVPARKARPTQQKLHTLLGRASTRYRRMHPN